MYCGIYHKICIPFVLLLGSLEGHKKQAASCPSIPPSLLTKLPPLVSFFRVLGYQHKALPAGSFETTPKIGPFVAKLSYYQFQLKFDCSKIFLPAEGYNFSNQKSKLLLLIPIIYRIRIRFLNVMRVELKENKKCVTLSLKKKFLEKLH